MNGKCACVRFFLGGLLLASMAATAGMLMACGRTHEALPLHLCSVSALCAAALTFYPCAALLDFLWYLGMPGAALALLFPAPMICRPQALMNAAYFLTHALIVIIPACRMACGMRVRRGRAAHMLLALQILGAAAALANRKLGANFLFLCAPPAGTPLERVYIPGDPAYVLALETLMILLCMGMERLGRYLGICE